MIEVILLAVGVAIGYVIRRPEMPEDKQFRYEMALLRIASYSGSGNGTAKMLARIARDAVEQERENDDE